MNYYNYAIKQLKNLKNDEMLLCTYDLMGCAEIKSITPKGMISMVDITNKRVYLNENQFNKMNRFCNVEEIITIVKR